jgi:hypothetical protein
LCAKIKKRVEKRGLSFGVVEDWLGMSEWETGLYDPNFEPKLGFIEKD